MTSFSGAPLIGVTAYLRLQHKTGWPYYVSYARNIQAIQAAGGVPILIPFDLHEDALREVYERIDGILLPGGGDVDPTHYQSTPQCDLREVLPERDRTEISLVNWAVAEDRPLLGICRGNQILNVALGGTLIQDIPSVIKTDLRHDILDSEKRSVLLHDVEIASDSQLARILGKTRIKVNSLHHQAIEKPASAVRITATAPDGIYEALELPDKRFVMAVQWHPEDMLEDVPEMRQLFSALVDAARANKAQKEQR